MATVPVVNFSMLFYPYFKILLIDKVRSMACALLGSEVYEDVTVQITVWTASK